MTNSTHATDAYIIFYHTKINILDKTPYPFKISEYALGSRFYHVFVQNIV